MVFDDRELVDRQPVVIGGNVEVDHAGLRPADGAVVSTILDRHTLHQHPVERPVANFQRRPFRPVQLAKGVVESIGSQCGVAFGQGILQAQFQDYLPVVGTLSAECIRSDVGTMGDVPTEAFEPVESGFLDVGFGDGGHGVSQGLTTFTSKPSKSLTLRVAMVRS